MEYKSIDHAKHNETVCDYLVKNTEFHDWIITTAFYSAIHYLKSSLFPLKEDGKTYNSFDEYCDHNKLHKSKHCLMRKLVENKCRISVANAYNQMLDLCWTARYSQYKFDSKIANFARSKLRKIANHCKPKP